MISRLVLIMALLGLILLSRSSALPPKEFDHDYSGRLVVVQLPAKDIHEACGGSKISRSRFLACAMRHGEICIIVLPKVEPGLVTIQQQNRLRHHEIGHCNGWLADHRGRRYDLDGGS